VNSDLLAALLSVVVVVQWVWIGALWWALRGAERDWEDLYRIAQRFSDDMQRRRADVVSQEADRG